MSRASRQRAAERQEVQRVVSALMDEAPAWRDWLGYHLRLLDLEYDPHHWITMEYVRW